MNIKEKSFEEVLTLYEPAIKKQLVSLRIYKNYEEFFQVGRVALWQAYERFNTDKGNFSTYAISTIRGTMMTYLSNETKYNEKHSELSAEMMELIPNDHQENALQFEILEAYTKPLTKREKTWVYEAILLQKKTTEIAADYGVSVNTVKSWRKSALKKMRELLNQGIVHKC